MKLELISDYSCPFCYLAEVRIQKVLKDLHANIQVKHICYQLDPKAPSFTLISSYEVFAQKYGVDIESAKAQMKPLEKQAEDMGVKINFAKIQSTSTLLAHEFAKAYEAQTKDSSVHIKLYQAYFELGYNLADEKDLYKVALSLGLSEPEYNHLMHPSQFKKECLSDLRSVEERKIQGIPQLYYKNQRLIRGLVDEAVFKKEITQCYLKSMEGH